MSTALSLENVSARYGERVVLHNARAVFVAGCVTGIVGPNGAGKTTLLRVALGLIPADSGSVEILGRDLRECSRDFLARSIAYLPQEGAAQWPVPVRRVVALGRMPHTSFFARQDYDGNAAVAEALDRCDVAQFAARRLDELSAGERARVLLARALATQAKVLLVDEPAAHLDPAHQLRLMELLRGEAARGVAIGITLHDLSLASRYCDDIAVLHDGRVIGQGAPGDALSDAALASVFGISAIRAGGPGADAIVPWARL